MKSPDRAWYETGMLKAYVGIATDEGLCSLHPERDDTMKFVRRAVRSERPRVGFWAVLDETQARCVQALFDGGLHREAMLFLDRTAKDMGRILPSDPRPDLH